jgi:small-conductance mechanosensitive channel
MNIGQIYATAHELMYYNKYLTALVMLAFFFLLAKLAYIVAEKIFLKIASKTETEFDDKLVRILRNPTSLLIFLIGFKMTFMELFSALSFEIYLEHVLDSIIAITVALTGIKVVNLVVDEFLLRKVAKLGSQANSQLFKLVHNFVVVIAYIVLFITILAIWGVQIGPFLAGLGLGGLAVALALQPTLANIFGGIALILDRTIKTGDVVKLDSGEMGEVYDIGLRSTRIKTPTNEVISIPNGKLVDSRIINSSVPDRTIRIDIDFGVAYGSKIDKVKKLALSCLNGDKRILNDPKPDVLFLQMADSSLNFRLMFYIHDLKDKWELHQLVIERLYNSLNKNKINIPFPQRELWVHNLKK